MKTKAIGTICKDRKEVMMCNDLYGRQWVGNSSAMYCMHGMPRLTEGNVLAVFDVPEVKRTRYEVETIDTPEFIDVDTKMDNVAALASRVGHGTSWLKS